MSASRERRIGEVWIVTNHWGWTPRGVATWIRAGWGFFETWGVEARDSRPRIYRRFLKLGPFITRIV
jgi:hypothetical protein